MGLETQTVIEGMPEQPAVEPRLEAPGRAKLRTVVREQTILAQICVDELISIDHKARSIWELTGLLAFGSEPLPGAAQDARRPRRPVCLGSAVVGQLVGLRR